MTHDCDLCGASASPPHELPQDPRISVCGSCGFVFVPERRSSQEIAESWKQIYRDKLYDPTWPAVKARLYYVAEWIDQNIGLAGKDLLDIGAGKGQFLTEASHRSARVFGIEPAAEGYDYRIIKWAIEDGPLDGGPWDIVTINWTLENCGDCLAMLKFARDHVKPDGWVVVATGSRILVPFKKPLSSYLNLEIPADLHCFRWSEKSLERAIALAGFCHEKSNYYNECDWLIKAAKPGQGSRLSYRKDNPRKVLGYFKAWAKAFP